MGVSEAMFYNWKKKYSGLGVSELRELRQLKEENSRVITPAAFIKDCIASEQNKEALPGAPASDPMIFAAEEYNPSASEKSSNQLQGFKHQNAPKF